MSKEKPRHFWSARAWNALCALEINPEAPLDVVRADLLKAAGSMGVFLLLKSQKNCGITTIDEILDKLGLTRSRDGHICRCALCGNQMQGPRA
jgi:hypothetical protein